MPRLALISLVLGLCSLAAPLLVACGSSQETAPQSGSGAGASPGQSSETGEGEPGAAEEGSADEEAEEAGSGIDMAALRALCAEGAEALDQEAYATSNAAVRQGDFRAALAALRGIAEAHPRASEAQVWIADAALKLEPPDPAAAIAALDRADAMIEAGCALPGTREEWVKTGSRAIALLMQRRAADARPILEGATERWPESPNFHYNLACVRCLEQNVDGCHEELTRTLASAAARRQEQTLGFRDHGPEHYAQVSRTDPDLALLRADPRYEAAVAPYSGEGAEQP